MSHTDSWAPRPWQTALEDDWIDFNGHLRDAFYLFLASRATDDLMEQVGLDESYRAATGGTLYTLEMHVHFLQEVKRDDVVTATLRPLAVDAKRLQARCEIACPRLDGPAAIVEMLLLHVTQKPSPKAAPFPEPVAQRLAQWLAAATPPSDDYGSRAIALKRPKVSGGTGTD